MKKIKIAVDIRDLHISKSGANTYLVELCQEMKLGSETFDYHFFDTLLPVYTGKNKFLKAYEHFSFFVWKQFTLPIKAALTGCKIVFCSDYFVPYFHIGFTTIPVFHDAFFWEFPTHYSKPWLWMFKIIGVSAARRSAFIVTVSRYSQMRISELAEIEKEKIIPIYLAPKSMQLNQTKSHQLINQRFSNLFSKKYILHVGTLEKRKNIGTLIDAFKWLINSGDQETQLVLVGQNSNKVFNNDLSLIEKINNDERLKSRIHLTGYVDNAELFEFYKNASIYVLPSINEGFGLPILEAFQFKIPVLIANASCLPEIAGNAALQFEPFDAYQLFQTIQSVLSDLSIRNHLVQKGTEQLSRFSWKNHLVELEQVFLQSLQSKK